MNMMAENESKSSPVVETIKQVIGCIATCIGLAVLLIGLNYAIDVFQLIIAML